MTRNRMPGLCSLKMINSAFKVANLSNGRIKTKVLLFLFI